MARCEASSVFRYQIARGAVLVSKYPDGVRAVETGRSSGTEMRAGVEGGRAGKLLSSPVGEGSIRGVASDS
ncbi:hypothetical protein CT0861_06570 [Colletotrichum tofieldiae]|uniref:Uncharacterized protein n=1 Tax=Colletotrichum tofieldiae TaxID=708197 RepID=A0A166SVE0_9PEZI|nr:hypothetical protein CT0861_06570 [Colletotrichum tofieldiae]